MTDETELENRIRAKAYDLWIEEGQPDGREMDHWDKARILVAIADDRTSLIPVAPPSPEEAALQATLGEFPTAMTDEGDRQQTPSRQAEPKFPDEKMPARPKTSSRKSAAKTPS